MSYVCEGEPLTKIIYIQTWHPKQRAVVPNVGHKQLRKKLHLIKKCCHKSIVTFDFLLFHKLSNNFENFDRQKTTNLLQIYEPDNGVKVISLESQINFWRNCNACVRVYL